ncbi:hypothetical protein SAMN05216548_10142 [Faunimonas pinastri]|uniref:Flagellar motor protein MotA n=1 Tax=Faunimonas pinastri TaxID=1855383 RepID=A0A1H8Z4X8_9HYPH|nr:flagellar motor protein MotA [Faunimonas pinastri]SEP59529.1 hypothetical protein SAMN05216548_10142 [Faunimonas pinastri]
MAREFDPYKLSSPRVFLVRIIIFLVIAAFVPIILHRQVQAAFLNNPGLNSLIVAVLVIGIILSIRNVVWLMPEVRWVNAFRRRGHDPFQASPRLLAPMATLLRDRAESMALSTSTWRSILDSIGNRLDENREILRYLTGLLVFLGLLGTFWGLLTTVGAVGATIQNLNTGSGDATTLFEDLKSGLAAPLSGMGISFSSSLFGLAGSLVLGFLDLQAGQAQNRFYTELEDWLSTLTDLEDFSVEEPEAGGSVQEIRQSVDRLARMISEDGPGRGNNAAVSSLAEGIQALVQHMRTEQQAVRDWMEAQAEQQVRLQATLDRLAVVSEEKAARIEGPAAERSGALSELRREG